MFFPMVHWKLNLLLALVAKADFVWKTLNKLIILTTYPFHKDKEYFLNYFFCEKFLQSDIFRTNNPKRIAFMHDFRRWWLIILQSHSSCKRFDFTKNFLFNTCLIKNWRTDLKLLRVLILIELLMRYSFVYFLFKFDNWGSK